MKVLKFGGSSVGSVESILNLKDIVEHQDQPVIVVVSALGGITDKLIATSRMAEKGDETYKNEVEAMRMRHHDMVNAIIADNEVRENLLCDIDRLFDELGSIYYGVFLIRDLSAKTLAAIVSYGERLSSIIVAALVEGAQWKDSRTFIKTENKHGKNLLASELTERLVREAFPNPVLTIVPGFISADKDSDEITNLGRGGSDYTAAIIAAALDAEVLEIWTDVNGFMTADPRVISSAYTIPELSYTEAMELCNFGAKVIYPPTIYPVCVKNIPIRVLNTFNKTNPGTIIKDRITDDGKAIKGISSISGTAIITVAGLSMVGVIGVNRRIFTALANRGISVFMVSQASSESSTSIGVRVEDKDEAVAVLNEEFEKEIATGAMYPMSCETGLATVAIVGSNMKHTPGIAGKLFGSLGRSGISVKACAQGASETNISFVVEERYLRKTLNVIHDSFFLSEYSVLNIFICGTGKVGANLIQQIHAQADELMRSRRLKLSVVGIANSRHAIFNREGIDLSDYRRLLAEAPETDIDGIRDSIIGMNIFNSVFVDCTASADVAALYETLLSHNISVVAANKIAASGNYDTYAGLKELALRRGVKFLFETNVGAGLPIISTINDLRGSGDRILKIEAVLSGTVNFIFNAIEKQGISFSEAVRKAKEEGYTEPDPRIDLTGRDVTRKIVILAREAGYRVEQDDVDNMQFVDSKVLEGSIDDFWASLPGIDKEFEEIRLKMKEQNKHLRLVASLSDGKVCVKLEAVDASHPFYRIEGSNNIILLTTDRYRVYPMLIQGYGAGAEVTAAGVFANIMSISNN